MSESTRKQFRAKYADLGMFASNLTVPMRRDIAEFASKNISSADIDALEVKAMELISFPSDEFYAADVSIKAGEKNELREELSVDARVIVSMAKIKWGVRSAQYRRFDAVKMTTESDGEFLTSCRRVHETAGDYLAELSPLGLTQAMLDEYEAKSDAFEQKLFEVSAAKETRILKTAERLELANELYALAAHYCLVGKIIWQDRDYSRYNDYLIYKFNGMKQKKSKKKAPEP